MIACWPPKNVSRNGSRSIEPCGSTGMTSMSSTEAATAPVPTTVADGFAAKIARTLFGCQ